MNAASVRQLTVGYGRHVVLDRVDVDFPTATMTAVVGPNGGGKSTLLKAILGLLPVTSGEISVLGRRLNDARTQVAYVPQADTTTPQFPITARQVVRMGRYPHIGWWRRLTAADHEAVEHALAVTGVDGYEDAEIDELSGGQRRRVFLARALAQAPDLYLLDEPFAGVDAATERHLLDVLTELCRSGRSVIAVHHRLDRVADDFDHAVLVAGRIVATGDPSSVVTPANLAAAHGLERTTPQ